MTMSTTPTTRYVTVPGARLHYQVRGAGPLLLVIGSPMASADFAPLADALAPHRTVVTYDPRGYAESAIDDSAQQSTPELRADDVTALLDDLGAESADVFGSSGGAVTGLAMVARHPGRVSTLVAHEPPLLELLPDAAAQREATRAIIDTFHRDGLHAAWSRFMVNAGFDMSQAPDGPPPAEPTAQELREAARFFDHDLSATTQYLPDLDALRAARIVAGVGAESRQLSTYRTSSALCELLGIASTEFPGDHGGFIGAPTAFADRLLEVLS